MGLMAEQERGRVIRKAVEVEATGSAVLEQRMAPVLAQEVVVAGLEPVRVRGLAAALDPEQEQAPAQGLVQEKVRGRMARAEAERVKEAGLAREAARAEASEKVLVRVPVPDLAPVRAPGTIRSRVLLLPAC